MIRMEEKRDLVKRDPATSFSCMRRNIYVRKCFLKLRLNYTANPSAMFNPTIFMLTRSEINLVNSGQEGTTTEQDKSNIAKSILSPTFNSINKLSVFSES